jgi:hypothetical protein
MDTDEKEKLAAMGNGEVRYWSGGVLRSSPWPTALCVPSPGQIEIKITIRITIKI